MKIEELHGRVADFFMDPASVDSGGINRMILMQHHLTTFGDFVQVDEVVGAARDERKGCFFDLFSQDIGAFCNGSDIVPFRSNDVDRDGDFLKAVVVKNMTKSGSHDKDG